MPPGKSGRVALKLIIDGLRPFCDGVEVDVRRFTLLVGKNASGKSLLMSLLWSLETSLITSIFVSLFSKDVEDVFRSSFSDTLTPMLERTGVARLFNDSWRLEIREPRAKVEVRGGNGGRVTSIDVSVGRVEPSGDLAKLVDALKAFGVSEKALELALGLGFTELLSQLFENDVLTGVTLDKLLELFEAPLLQRALRSTIMSIVKSLVTPVYVPDGRSGLARIMLSPAAYASLKLQDEHFLDFVRAIVETGYKPSEAARAFLKELGVENVTVAGSRVYLSYWWGGESELHEAPSGLRETLYLVILLESPVGTLYIEEPEAHLHPPAVQKLTVLLASAVSSLRKKIVVSTHDPLVAAQVNDLILASKLRGNEEALRKYAEALGVPTSVLEEALLNPDDVVLNVLLIDKDRRCTCIEALEATAEGYSEEYFARIVDALDATRVYLSALLEKAGSRKGG